MINTPDIPEIIDPKGIDLALLEIQGKLIDGLEWLDHSFGKAQRLMTEKERTVFKYPGVYVGKKEYLNVFPDSHIGNFSFFDVLDGSKVNHKTRSIHDIDSKIGVVFWFDLSKVYSNDWQQRTNENVKHEVLELLSSMTLKRSSINISNYWERSEKIYPDYSITEIKNQFLMRPFGGFRVDFDMKYKHKPNC